MGADWARWVPYGLPQLPLVVQLALQASRALLRGVRLLLQAADLSAHCLQRAAPRHGEAGGGAGDAGCCAQPGPWATAAARKSRPAGWRPAAGGGRGLGRRYRAGRGGPCSARPKFCACSWPRERAADTPGMRLGWDGRPRATAWGFHRTPNRLPHPGTLGNGAWTLRATATPAGHGSAGSEIPIPTPRQSE